jgi:signal transduction histidine kinase
MPDLDRMTIKEFEDSMAAILNAIAAAMETDNPARLGSVIKQSPLHGIDRFLQNFTLDGLLTEERILRSAITVELSEQMDRPLTDNEATALHELIDVMLEQSVLAFIRRRTQQQEQSIQQQMTSVHRLADLGTLVAGVAHDAANLLLPLRMSVDRLKRQDLPEEARSNIQLIAHVFQHFQNTIVNLRWLSIDTTHRRAANHSLDLHEFIDDFQQFQRTMLPQSIALACDIPHGLPRIPISQAALSQALFNLIRNAQQAILANQERGNITVHAQMGSDDSVQVIVEDDGPGMSASIRKRCREPFFSTNESGTGLGLALVQALVNGSGGTIDVESPPSGKGNGTRFIIFFPGVITTKADEAVDSIS